MVEFTPETSEGQQPHRRKRVTHRIARSRLGKLLLRRNTLIAVGGIFLALYLGQRGLSYVDLMVVFATSIIAVIIFNGERGVQLGFVLWVLTLALGYRTVKITTNLQLHPSEILLWLLLACICAHRQLRTQSRLTLPLWTWLMIPFWVAAWWPLIPGYAQWDQMFSEFRNFLLLIPLMIVATVVLQQTHNWPRLLLAFLAASTWIAVLGILEFWVSGIATVFPAFMTKSTAGIIEGFERASFSFWGGPMATFVCALALPLTIVAARWWRAHWQRALILGSAISQIIAVYIGGYRSIWLFLVIEIVLACLLSLKRQRVAFAAISLAVIIGGYQFIPEAGSNRALSGVAALRGQAIDSSSRVRFDRAGSALDELIAAPLGNGWSAAGWVHSDFIQVGANLGLLGGLIFLGGYLFTLWRLGRRVLHESRDGAQGDLGVSLLLAYISAGGILATQGVEVLPQLALPVWFVWVLVEVWLVNPVSVIEVSEGSSVTEMDRESYPAKHWWAPPLAGTQGVRH